MTEYFVGLMSGTSADGIDAALVDLSCAQPKLIGAYYLPYEPAFRKDILALCRTGANEINRLGECDVKLGKLFARAVFELLKQQKIDAKEIRAIGSHGHTVRHNPLHHFTLQIGDPNILCAETQIMTVSDFRRKDMAYGGEGAPLVPAFHQALFQHPEKNRVIVNIGGIANVTLLEKDHVKGFDTGPGNTLLDLWAEKHLNLPRDEKGKWAATGTIQNKLLTQLLADPFFSRPPPKSTGKEYFNLSWLETFLPSSFQREDIQATLVELTARSILDAIPYSSADLFICGGGWHNDFLIQRLRAHSPYEIASTEKIGVHPDWVEAMAFAWLAKQTLEKAPANLPVVTGAKRKTVLGGVYYP